VPELEVPPLVVLLDPPPPPLPLFGVYVVSVQAVLSAHAPPLDQFWATPEVYVAIDQPFELAAVVLSSVVVTLS
jgi:hypothetical protein